MTSNERSFEIIVEKGVNAGDISFPHNVFFRLPECLNHMSHI